MLNKILPVHDWLPSGASEEKASADWCVQNLVLVSERIGSRRCEVPMWLLRDELVAFDMNRWS